MGRTVLPYGGFTTAQIKSRATFPAQSDIIDLTTSLDCRWTKINDFRRTIRENVQGLVSLLKSAKRNIYSYFNSGKWKYDIGTDTLSFVDQISVYEIGDVACYNHDAVSPNKINVTSSVVITDVTSPPYAVTINATIKMEEIPWDDVETTRVEEVRMDVYRGATFLKETRIAYNQSGVTFSESVDIPLFSSTSLTLKFYFDEVLEDRMCPIPNVGNSTVIVTLWYSPFIGTVELGTNWVDGETLLYDSGSLDRISNGYSLTFNGIDEDTPTDGEPDFQGNVDLYARLNNGSWQFCETFYMARTSDTDAIGILPFSIDWNDNVDFEIV